MARFVLLPTIDSCPGVRVSVFVDAAEVDSVVPQRHQHPSGGSSWPTCIVFSKSGSGFWISLPAREVRQRLTEGGLYG